MSSEERRWLGLNLTERIAEACTMDMSDGEAADWTGFEDSDI